MTARILLIEDDPSIARFVELAVECLPDHAPEAPAVTLTVATLVSEARTALAQGGWQLVISDLMLPDGSAEVLLTDGLALAPGAPPWVVFSAGVQEERRAALLSRGVARLLRKPVPLTELLDTVADMLARGARAAVAPPRSGPDPVAQHFGGDREMYEVFRQGCLQRFADDLAQGHAAMAAGDAAALRRVAHGLKAVLELIGEPGMSAQARQLENEAAACAPGQPLPSGWEALALGLTELRAR
ncbi:Hpt domain-containing protein [Roseateles sp. BYS87W]|uniref:Hpt domain-containing protein n=1 Tax=Pelomonas baiyunensis TaxID=3299026 RepID=A0ABW7H157_9BURK